MLVPSIGPDSPIGDKHYKAPRAFPIGPFQKYKHNPILRPNPDHDFESAYIYNPAAIVADGKVFLLYRAQNKARTLSIGLAWLTDGFDFKRLPHPVLEPTEPWEKGGGCEDPRVVWDNDTKQFYMTYTAYDGHLARLCVAVSRDLLHWDKHPPVIEHDRFDEICTALNGTQFIRRGWLKSGAMFTDRHADGKYYMIWGEAGLQLASSTDLVHWQISNRVWAKGLFDWQNRLIEAGPPPIKLAGTNKYIFFYNSSTTGGGRYPKGTYTISQMLVDYDNLHDGPLARMEQPCLVPEADNETEGQVNNVVFTEGVVQFQGRWFLYYGQGDSEVGVAYCAAE